ncbi:MAG: ATP-binding protein [Nitrospiria bacterium]
MNKLSVKIKLSLLFSLIITVACVVIGWVFFDHSKDVYTENFMKRGLLLTENLAYNSWFAVFTENKTDLDRLIAGVLLSKEVVHGSILNREGQILSQKGTLSLPENRSRRPTTSKWNVPEGTLPVHTVLLDDGTEIFIFSAPVVSVASKDIGRSFPQELLDDKGMKADSIEDATEGTARIFLSSKVLDHQIRRALKKGIIVTVFMIAVGMGLGYFLALTYSRNLLVLASSAIKVSEGDFSQMIPVRSHDEVGMLTTIFNKMARSLDLRDQEMQKLHQGLSHLNEVLERRVDERTSALEGALQEVTREKKKTENILHQIADGVIVTDIKEEVVLINEAARKMLRGPTGDKEAEISISDFPDLQEILKEPEEFLFCELEIDGHNERGPSSVEVTVTSLKSKKDGTLGRVAVLHDISRFKEVDRLKSEFVSQVSHEIRTPLTSIRGYIENLLDEIPGEISPPQREYLGRMDKNAERLTYLINDLLDISRIESGKMQVDLKSLPLHRLLEESVNEMRSLALSKNIDMTLHIGHNPSNIIGDWDKLVQVMTNLIYNAVKFTPSGGNISVSLSAEEEKMVVSVQDNGIGISEADLPYIFDRFYSVANSNLNLHEGTGLGLFIAKKLISLQGGELRVRSEIRKGSTFFFSLPIEHVTLNRIS